VACTGIFGAAGSAWLDSLRLPQPHAGKVTSLRQLAGALSTEITMIGGVIADLLAGDRGYRVIRQLPGIGPVLAAVIIAEIGDVTRFELDDRRWLRAQELARLMAPGRSRCRTFTRWTATTFAPTMTI
jgi:transposase